MSAGRGLGGGGRRRDGSRRGLGARSTTAAPTGRAARRRRAPEPRSASPLRRRNARVGAFGAGRAAGRALSGRDWLVGPGGGGRLRGKSFHFGLTACPWLTVFKSLLKAQLRKEKPLG